MGYAKNLDLSFEILDAEKPDTLNWPFILTL